MQFFEQFETLHIMAVFVAIAISTSVATIYYLKKKRQSAPSQTPIPVAVNWSERLFMGLHKTRTEVWGKLETLLNRSDLGEQELEELEELLYTADIGPKLVQELLQEVKKEKKNGVNQQHVIYQLLKSKFTPVQGQIANELFVNVQGRKSPYVIMIVGVNGAGKTTTIGKLATRLTRQGANVVVGACDTFRAAAVEQLQIWCDRAGATMVRAKENSAPSGVGHQALELAIKSGADYCLLDTAGRLHNKQDLMQELKKSKQVLSKLVPDAPHQVLLVLDAIAGQNSLRQAQEFNKALGLTGLIFTKCDGSSKAGSAVAIVQDLKVPIAYIGVGEGVDDLDRFNVDEYLGALLNLPASPSLVRDESRANMTN